MGLLNPSHESKDFNNVIESVVKYFLNRTLKYDHSVEYTLFNPSIADFILNRIKDNSEILSHAFLSLRSVESLRVLFSLKVNKIVDESSFLEITNQLLRQIDINNVKNVQETDYLIKLFDIAKHDIKKCHMFYQKLVNDSLHFTLYAEVTETLLEMLDDELDLKISEGFLVNLIEATYVDITDINRLIGLIEMVNKTDVVLEVLNKLIESYIDGEVDATVSSLSGSDFDPEYDEEGLVYFKPKDIENFIE